MKTSISRLSLLLTIILFCLTNVNAQLINNKQKDKIYLTNSFKDKVLKMKKSLTNKLVNYTGNDLSLYGALSLNNQSINDQGITAPINYAFDAVNNNTFKPGYSGGFRIDGIYKEKHCYSLSFAVNSVSTGSDYKNKYTIAPFTGDYTHFKADNKYTTISIAAHYKMLLPVNDMRRYKFYAIAGPSLDYKISTISKEQLINGAGNRAFINADLGAEFDNKGYYVLYAHYKLGANMANSSVPVQLNRFEIGMSIKAKDLF